LEFKVDIPTITSHNYIVCIIFIIEYDPYLVVIRINVYIKRRI